MPLPFYVALTGAALVTHATPDTVTLTLEAPERVAPSAPVTFTVVLANEGATPRAVYLTGRPPALDVMVEEEGGRVVWRRLEGEVVSMVLQVIELAPGERRTFRATWDLRSNDGESVPAGVYRVWARLPTQGSEALVTARAALRVEGGVP